MANEYRSRVYTDRPDYADFESPEKFQAIMGIMREEMNKQRKVVITTTYNEMGIIIDTKAEEVVQPHLQPTCNQLATNTISRRAAIDAADEIIARDESGNNDVVKAMTAWKEYIKDLPSAQPEPEKRTAETAQNVSDSDLISRKAAIDGRIPIQRTNGVEIYYDEAVPIEYLKRLPPAQPDIAENLSQYKCYITDEDGLQHEVIHTGDIRRVTGWTI